jgi:hypothetical protein
VEITESCLDAETLAAWVDGGLTAPELGRARAHVAGCVRCQTMAGTLARISAAAPAAKAEAAPRPWLAWLVPLMAAAAAVTIWVAIPGSQLDSRVPPPLPPAAAPVQQPAQPTAQAPSAAPAPIPGPAPTAAATAAATPAAKSTSAPAPSPPSARERSVEMRTDAATLPALDKATPQEPVVAGEAPIVPPSAAPPPPVPLAAPRVPVGAGANAGGLAGGGVSGAPSAGAAMRAQSSAASPKALDALESARSTVRQNLASPPVEIVSPNSMIRWRLAGNNVERSTNGGATWETTATAAHGRLGAFANGGVGSGRVRCSAGLH